MYARRASCWSSSRSSGIDRTVYSVAGSDRPSAVRGPSVADVLEADASAEESSAGALSAAAVPRCRRPAYRREPTGSLSHRRKSILRAMRLTGKVLLRPIDKSSCTTSVSGCADDTEDDLPTGTARHDGCRIYQDDDDPISGPLVLQPVRLRRICSFRAACTHRPGRDRSGWGLVSPSLCLGRGRRGRWLRWGAGIMADTVYRRQPMGEAVTVPLGG